MDKKTAVTLAKMHIGKVMTDTNLIIQYMQLHKLASFYHAVQKLDEEVKLLSEAENK
jgi:hypothetical protein